jgi:hypothetical protein
LPATLQPCYRARKLHDDRKAEINQTLTQVDNTMEQLDELTAHVDKWTKGKQKYEAHLQVRWRAVLRCAVLAWTHTRLQVCDTA